MKKGLTMFMLLMLCIGSTAQEKLFEEAIRKGRSANKFYLAKNEKGKGQSIEKVRNYAKNHNYLLGKYTTKEIERFGDKQTALDEFSFIPYNDYPAYVYAYTNSGLKYADLKQRGSCWLFVGEKFLKFDNVLWSGEIKNGMLHGKGSGFWVDDNNRFFNYVKGEFQNGLPVGQQSVMNYKLKASQPDDVSFSLTSNVEVGRLSNGLASFSVSGGKWGFVDAVGAIVIPPSFDSVIKEFSNDRAEVVSSDKEIIINKQGTYVDLTARQKQVNAQQKAKERQEELRRQQEEKRKQLAQQQKDIERRRLAAEAEKRRVARFKACEPGDRVYYSQEWQKTEGWLFFSTTHSYTMRVVCFVEQNIKNGERLQIRVGSVESSSSSYYSTPKIDGIEYRKGDVLWIKPLNDTRWQIE